MPFVDYGRRCTEASSSSAVKKVLMFVYLTPVPFQRVSAISSAKKAHLFVLIRGCIIDVVQAQSVKTYFCSYESACAQSCLSLAGGCLKEEAFFIVYSCTAV